MRVSVKSLLVLIAGVALAIGLFKLKYPSHAWRQRITFVVATPQGEKVGSAVQAVEWTPNPIFKDGAAFHLTLKGEAVAVEIAPGRVLFALLTRPGEYEHTGLIALYQFGGGRPDRGDFPWADSDFAAVRAARGAAATPLWPDLYPRLVTFRDINDPTTVEQVDPADLAASFGEGVKLARATIELTDAQVTTGIEKRLNWLNRYYDKRLDGQRYMSSDAKNLLANSLSAGSFKSGGRK